MDNVKTGDIDFFIYELNRIRKSVQLYTELFCDQSNLDEINKFSEDVFWIFRRSLHDEILISISRLYDSQEARDKLSKLESRENLSQRNILKNYEPFITEEINNIRDECKSIFQKLKIQNYRNWKVAHNDKLTCLLESRVTHQMAPELLVSLLDCSMDLMIKLKASVLRTEKVPVPVNINEKFVGKGVWFVEKLKGDYGAR